MAQGINRGVDYKHRQKCLCDRSEDRVVEVATGRKTGHYKG